VKQIFEIEASCCGQKDAAFRKQVPKAGNSLFRDINRRAFFEDTFICFIDNKDVKLVLVYESLLHCQYWDVLTGFAKHLSQLIYQEKF